MNYRLYRLFATQNRTLGMLQRNMSRVLLGLKKNGDIRLPKFPECLVDLFSKQSNTVMVSCKLEKNILVLSHDANGVVLQHSPKCSFRIINQENVIEHEINPEKQDADINVAVSIIVESSDHHVLMTRRPAHMRTSPQVWVAPGGHLELNESLYEGGVREVREETGLNVTTGDAEILCLWENVYPLLLGFGSPQAHVLIVYFHVRMQETHKELQSQIRLDPAEVDACTWLSSTAVSDLLHRNTTGARHKQYAFENGLIVEKELDPNTMFNKLLWREREPHSGVQCALRKWVEKMETFNGWTSKM